MATTTMTPATIEERKQRAVDACKHAYAPLPPTTPGAPSLCWSGRMQKAIQLGHEAYEAGDTDRAKQISQAISVISKEAEKAHSVAQDACQNYQGMCASLGREPADVMPPKCQCEGCRIGNQQTNFFAAESTLRKAIFNLIMPYDAGDKLPRLCGLIDTKDTKALWALLAAIGEAAKTYRQAAEAFGIDVDYHQWHKVLK